MSTALTTTDPTVADDDLAAIAATAATFFAERAPVAALLDRPTGSGGTPFDRALYTDLAGLDFFRLTVPPEVGGLGLPMAATGAICEAAGREMVTGPWFDQLVAIEMLARHGAPDELVGRLLDADALAAVGFGARAPGDGLRLDPGTGTLSGSIGGLCCGDQVELWVLLVPQVGDGGHVVVVDPAAPGVRRSEPVTSIDPHWYGISAEFTDVVPTAVLPCPGDGIESGIAYAGGLVAAYSAGGSQRLLDEAVTHVRQRRQFGRPIGAFQAVKHRAAESLIALVHARALTRSALDRGDVHQLRLARIAADRCYRSTAETALQLHGGIGFTAESVVHLYLKNAQRLRTWPVSSGTQLADLRTELGLEGDGGDHDGD